MVQCFQCTTRRGIIKRPSDGLPYCQECFFEIVERLVHEALQSLFDRQVLKAGMKIAIAASGGKDSTVLAYLLKLLNERHNYQLDLCLVSVDEGIKGYRDDSLATVQKNQQDYQLPLLIVSYAELFAGWTMDRIVPLTGLGTNCTFCGILRRTALELGARRLGVDFIATGHNADDMAETLLLNLVRGDLARLPHSVQMVTMQSLSPNSGGDEDDLLAVPRIKPFKWLYEKEIVMYAYFRKLHYFSTECTYAPGAFRGHAREFLKDLERLHPQYISHILRAGDYLSDIFHHPNHERNERKIVPIGQCHKCKCMTNANINDKVMPLCKACQIVLALDEGNPLRILGNSRRYTTKDRLTDVLATTDNDIGCASNPSRSGEGDLY